MEHKKTLNIVQAKTPKKKEAKTLSSQLSKSENTIL